MTGESAHWMEVFKRLGALWIHDENPRRPHALLTSGKHSNGFFNGSLVVKEPAILERVCRQLIEMHLHGKMVQVVVGQAFGSITMAHEIARQLNVQAIFTEPVEVDGEKKLQIKRFEVNPSRIHMVVEDVITTGGTTVRTIDHLMEGGASVSSCVLALVNRSGLAKLGDRREIKALIDHPMPTWDASECPYCRMGSEAIRPKGNWDRFTADYV